MPAELSAAAAAVILALHFLVVAFNIFGMIAVPLGARRGWRFVRVAWWRILHLALMAMVAVQALFGRACILTIWQTALENGGDPAAAQPMIQRWMEAVLFWDLPPWLFAAAYTVLFVYCLALWVVVPPARAANI
jgi:hypothetical protein